MFHFLFLTLSLVAQQDAGFHSVDLLLDLDSEILLHEPAEQRLILSAMLCETKERLRTVEDAFHHNATATLYFTRARLDEKIEEIQLKLDVLGFFRLACGDYDVSQLSSCLIVAPPAWCSRDRNTQVRVHAAELLGDVQ